MTNINMGILLKTILDKTDITKSNNLISQYFCKKDYESYLEYIQKKLNGGVLLQEIDDATIALYKILGYNCTKVGESVIFAKQNWIDEQIHKLTTKER